ncbi:MAG TPA: peptide-methionine (S)-S-oxide reductase MsrA [Candidatus Baltobacteraceae bacterium]|nr:peptide-methionine (S)-S-oxide reductase MsrA [Candidatus Baltobacteraceae bacterium]
MNRFRALTLATLTLFVAATTPAPAATQHVVLAGGCFWGMQAVFESLRGVTRVVAGFSGGAADTAHYDMVSTGTTGHAESVDVTYDPSKISFDQLLAVYFLVAHDPTELNRQGPDDGTQYRSEIFFTTPQQQAQATLAIASLEKRHVFPDPIVTIVAPLRGFYPAEAYHQDFLVHNPDNDYIVYNDLPKLRALRARFPELVNENAAPIRVIAKN